MTDDVRERGCEEYGDELAELALGVLTGRDRARVLSHVDSCPRCAEELEILSRTGGLGGAGGSGYGAAAGIRGAPLRADGPGRRRAAAPATPSVALGAGRGLRRRGGPGARSRAEPDVVVLDSDHGDRVADRARTGW